MEGVRLVLRDDQWARMEPHLRGKPTDCGVTADNGRFVEAVLWIVRTSSPWRDLPLVFGNWNSVFRRFSRGRGMVSGGVFSMRWPMIRTSNT